MNNPSVKRTLGATLLLVSFVLAAGWTAEGSDSDRASDFDHVDDYYAAKAYGSSGGYYGSSGGYYGSSGGSGTESHHLRWVSYYFGYSRPSNDDFANSTWIYDASGEVWGCNAYATYESSEPMYEDYECEHSIWYTWKAPESGVVSFSCRGSTSAGDPFDSMLCVYTGSSLANLTEVAANDDEDDTITEYTSLVSFSVTAGEVFHIAVSDRWGDDETTGDIRLAWHMDGYEADVAQAVWRFYSKNYKGHFYTMDEDEMWSLRYTNPNWKYEGEAYYSNPDGGGVLRPLYRFYSKGYKAHFFTIDPDERDSLIYGNPNWSFEGIAYYVQDEPGPETLPVYRFWSKKYRHHFFTMDEDEMWTIRMTNPNWKYEGVAYYAIP